VGYSPGSIVTKHFSLRTEFDAAIDGHRAAGDWWPHLTPEILYVRARDLSYGYRFAEGDSLARLPAACTRLRAQTVVQNLAALLSPTAAIRIDGYPNVPVLTLPVVMNQMSSWRASVESGPTPPMWWLDQLHELGHTFEWHLQPTHGDLWARNIIVGRRRLSLIDFDRCCFAPVWFDATRLLSRGLSDERYSTLETMFRPNDAMWDFLPSWLGRTVRIALRPEHIYFCLCYYALRTLAWYGSADGRAESYDPTGKLRKFLVSLGSADTSIEYITSYLR
jgi:hypothetical protein